MRIVRFILLVVVLSAAGAGLVAYRAYQQAHAPYKGYSGEEVFFTVPRGATGSSIGASLETQGIISDRRLFGYALRLRGESGQLKAGEYRFSRPMSTVEVVDRLVAGDIYTFAVTVPEGLTLRETAAHLAEQEVGDARALEETFENGEALIAMLDPGAESLEGYLFPTTYRFARNPEPREVARTMTAQFKEVFDDERRRRAGELGLRPREVVTLASVIEKETGSADERPLIASVFWNRLERGMPLASDPTIIYALKMDGRFDGNLRRADLELDSPYNTYRRAGLPPGPIASPGKESMDAVLYPKKTSYLYFVSKNDGTHHFSKTYREHLNAVRKYQVEYFRRRRQQNGGPS